MKKLFFTLIIMTSLLVVGCGNDDASTDSRVEKIKQQMTIEKYIADNDLDAQKTASGLHYVIELEGNGEHPTLNDNVTVHYHGYFTDGQVFDSSVDRGESISFGLRQVIAGWQEGIPLFSKGGKGKLIIPSELGYGSRDSGPIPGNSVLIFDVELIDF